MATNDLKINRLKLNDELSNQASRFASAAESAEKLHKEAKRLSLQLRIMIDKEAQIIKQRYRNVSPSKSPTETSVKELVRGKPEVQALENQLLEASHGYRMAKILVEAYKMRADTMIALANNVRQERKQSDKRVVT